MLDFAERGKPEYPERKLSKQRREPTSKNNLKPVKPIIPAEWGYLDNTKHSFFGSVRWNSLILAGTGLLSLGILTLTPGWENEIKKRTEKSFEIEVDQWALKCNYPTTKASSSITFHRACFKELSITQ